MTNYLDFIGRFFVYGLANFVDHFAIPEILIDLAVKMKQELDAMPSCRDLAAFITSLVVGGPSFGQTFIESASLLRSML